MIVTVAEIQMTWPKYINAINKIIKHFQDNNIRFDIIIGLTRGGLIPGVIASHKLDIPMMPFNPHVLHSNGTPREPVNLPISPTVIRKVLIMDDISDTGKTFDKTVKFFTNSGFNVVTAAVYINKKTAIFEPDFVLYDSHKKWVVFPYEIENE